MSKQHPTDFIHGLLSSHVHKAYKVCREGGTVKEGDIVQFTLNANNDNLNGEFDSANYNNQLKDWHVHKKYGDTTKSSNYYGILYVNDVVKQAVLAHCGTDVWGSLTGQSNTLKSACKMLTKQVGSQQMAVYKSTEDAVKIVCSEGSHTEGYSLSFTGHILGGWLAELSVLFCHQDFNCGIADNVKSVTFDSPGTAGQEVSYRSSIQNENTTNVLPFLNMVTYLSAPNIFNICHGHIGKVYSLSTDAPSVPVIPDKKGVAHWISSRIPTSISKFIAEKKSYINALSAGSNLNLMLATFDPKTGIPAPSKYKEVLDWPSIQYGPKFTNYISKLCTKGLEAGIRIGITTAGGTPHLASPVAALTAPIGTSLISKLIPTTTYCVLTNIVVGFLVNDHKLEQLFQTYKRNNTTNIIVDLSYPVPEDQKNEKDFYLKYKGHYKVKEVDLTKATFSGTQGTLEWYLWQLSGWSETQINCKFSDPTTAQELLNLKGQYTITAPKGQGPAIGNREIESINNSNMQKPKVEELKDKMSMLIKSDKSNDVVKLLGGEMPVTERILDMQEAAKKYVKDFSANNVMTKQRQDNNNIFSQVEKLVDDLGKQEYSRVSTVSREHLLNSLYCMHALASYYLYDKHNGQKAREILLSSKRLAEEYVLHKSDDNFKEKVKANFDSLNEKIYAELVKIKHLSEMYTSIIYLLGRTYIYQGDKNDGEKYFELSKYLGEKLGLFEGYLSSRSGLGVIKMCQAEEYIKKKEYQQAESKLNEAIELYKELKVNNTTYKNEYKPIEEGEYKEVTPTKDAHNQVECSERLIKCYMQLTILPINYVSELSNQFIGSDEFPGILKQLKDIAPKKIASIYNSLGQTLLTLFDKKVDFREFKAAIAEELKSMKEKVNITEITDELSFIKQIFVLAEKKASVSDFAEADAHDGLSKVCERQLEQEEVKENLTLKKQLEDERSEHERIKDDINKELNRGTKKEASGEANLDIEVASSSAEIETETASSSTNVPNLSGLVILPHS